jgi:hypothetical protein
MEAEADRRAMEGTVEPVFYQGQPAGFWYDAESNVVPAGNALAVRFEQHGVRKFSDSLLMFRLKALKPEKYRERVDKQVSGPGGGPVPVQMQDLSGLADLDQYERNQLRELLRRRLERSPERSD